MSTITEVKNITDLEFQEPNKYAVVIYNNDSTPMELVVDILFEIFNHPKHTAYELTMKIHHEGSAVAGVYNYEIAEQKAIEAVKVSRSEGYPLVVKLQEK